MLRASTGKAMTRLSLLWILLLPALAAAAPDRAGLIEAWEAAMRRDGQLEPQADGDYRYRSDSIGYDGRLKRLTAIVRTDGMPGEGVPGIQATGSVDFELPDLPMSSQGTQSPGLLGWKSERQNFFYDIDRQAWLSMSEWARADRGPGDEQAAPDRWRAWALTYGPLLVLFVFLAAVLAGASRQQRRVRALMAESHEINRMGRENLDRAAELREAQSAATQESLELTRRLAATLEAILDELRRRPRS